MSGNERAFNSDDFDEEIEIARTRVKKEGYGSVFAVSREASCPNCGEPIDLSQSFCRYCSGSSQISPHYDYIPEEIVTRAMLDADSYSF